MFENMNPMDRPTAWLEIFILMLGAFIIGYLFARSYYKRKAQKDLEASHKEIRTLKTLGGSKTNTAARAADSGFETIDKPGTIKAVKTRERAGVAVESKKNTNQLAVEKSSKIIPENRAVPLDIPVLDFNSFGRASETDKDDLKKISGVGPFIEKKLNSIGIYTFQQISKFSKKDIETVTSLIQFFPGRIERDDWRGQALKLRDATN